MNKKQKKARLKKLNKQRKDARPNKWGKCTKLKFCGDCGFICNNQQFAYKNGKFLCEICQVKDEYQYEKQKIDLKQHTVKTFEEYCYGFVGSGMSIPKHYEALIKALSLKMM